MWEAQSLVLLLVLFHSWGNHERWLESSVFCTWGLKGRFTCPKSSRLRVGGSLQDSSLVHPGEHRASLRGSTAVYSSGPFLLSVFETGSHCVSQAGLKRLDSGHPSCLSLLSSWTVACATAASCALSRMPLFLPLPPLAAVISQCFCYCHCCIYLTTSSWFSALLNRNLGVVLCLSWDIKCVVCVKYFLFYSDVIFHSFFFF